MKEEQRTVEDAKLQAGKDRTKGPTVKQMNSTMQTSTEKTQPKEEISSKEETVTWIKRTVREEANTQKKNTSKDRIMTHMEAPQETDTVQEIDIDQEKEKEASQERDTIQMMGTV